MTEVEALVRIGMAALMGAMLGLEREVTAKPAGLRTHMLVSMGSALFMVGSILLALEFNPVTPAGVDPTRIASTIVTGVGFLGAGMILRSGDRVLGLTTAAGIWVAAAIGMLIGAGYFVVGIGAVILSLITLIGLRIIEQRFLHRSDAVRLNEEDE